MPSIKPQAGIIGPKKRVLEFYDIIIEELEGQGRTGYADVFKANKGIISNHLFHYRDKHFFELKQEDFLTIKFLKESFRSRVNPFSPSFERFLY